MFISSVVDKKDSSDSVDFDDEMVDGMDENSLKNQLELEKSKKILEFKEKELARLDTIKRKMTKKVIRLSSYEDLSKFADVVQRAKHNDEITNASIRQAQRKAERQKMEA